MSFPYLLLIVVTGLNLALAILVYFRNRRNPINISYGLIALSVSAWALTNGIFQATDDIKTAFIAAVLSYITAIMIASSFYYFSLVFPKTKDAVVNYKKAVVFSALTMIGLVLWPGFVIESVAFSVGGKSIVTGAGLYFFAVYILAFFLLAFVNLIKEYKMSSGRFKAQLKYLFLGTFISAVFGVFFNLILPMLGNYRYVWLGPDFTIIMIAFIGYAIVNAYFAPFRPLISD